MTVAYHEQIAPAAPSRQLSIGGRRFPLLASAATPFDHREHRSSDTALGRRCVMCRSTSALGRTGRRFAGLGCFIDDVPPKHLAGRFGVRSSFRAIDGIGKRSTAPLASINHETADHLLHNRAEPLKRHLSAPAVYVLKRRCGVIGIDQNPLGASQNVNDC